jgi:phage terminase large subunit GpA
MNELKVDREFLKNGDVKTRLRALKTDWISRLIYLDGNPFSFRGRNYLLPIYNNPAARKLLMCGRQVEKTTMLANEIIISSVIQPYYKTLYVSPSHSQTRAFSNQKLKPWITDSPIIAKYFQSSKISQQVFERGFTNGSLCFLRSAFLTADRVRGLSSYMLCLDELQDLLTSNIPVIEECLSHAPNPVEIMSGTPKSLENPIQIYWEGSSQCEWLVPCDRHGPVYYNYLDEQNIGLKGLICKKCGNPLDPTKGQWIAFSKEREIMGYRISQLMVPWYQEPSKWKELVWKKENLSKGSLYNECLGISYDSASKPITRMELMSCCSTKHKFYHRPDAFTNRVEIFAGIDWGEGTDGTERGAKGKIRNASYTVLTLGMYIDQIHFYYLYYRRFEGKDALPSFCVNEIINVCRAFKVKCIGADWGHGWGVNERLEEAFGIHRVIKFQHVGNQRQRKKYDEIGHKFQLSRNEVITDYLKDIKDHKIVWPDWEEVKNYLCDFEHIYCEYKEATRQMVYDHKPSEPDDALHSSIYCKEAADNFYGKQR